MSSLAGGAQAEVSGELQEGEAEEQDIGALLVGLVSERTGYPPEMLDHGLDLEADLGVDSIKRVEILSSMTEQAPDLPEVDTGEMAAMQTLGQIVDYMRALTPGAGAAPASTS